MITLAKVLFVVGIAFVTYGLARWQIVTELRGDHQKDMESLIAMHLEHSTNLNAGPRSPQYRKGDVLAAHYPAWQQAVLPCAVGFVLLATSHYCGQHKNTTYGADA
jgi:hypothetical protein